jgi:hypothetical protein
MVDLGMAQKTRPALILRIGYSDDDRALVTVVSHTTTLRGSEFEISVLCHSSNLAHLWFRALPPFPESGFCIGLGASHRINLPPSKMECAAGSDSKIAMATKRSVDSNQ